jgi:hypothetical protein
MGQRGGRLTLLFIPNVLYELGERAITPEGVKGGDAMWNISGPLLLLLLGSFQRLLLCSNGPKGESWLSP